MGDTQREWVRSWLIKAHSDLRSARALVALPEPATDTASQSSPGFRLPLVPPWLHAVRPTFLHAAHRYCLPSKNA
jgi:hypothetical protein